MLINLKVKTLDARTHDFSIDNELTIRQFKDQIAVKTNIAAENQRIIYQGRVLADDKQVKEYDVDGKVLHVAERPPFSQRGANATNNDEPSRDFRSVTGRPTTRNMRNSPYFRALDGMLVGTMAIPVNNGNLTAAGNRTPPNRFPNSSSFCINRITVAQHMIDCANNIAAYLENPEIGLNNQPLDILQRGHWTMESTVVEVGVSTDMPRNNNIIDMVQDAVSAALSRNQPGRNYTVVQLPTVYTNEPGAENSQQQPQPSNDAGNEASNDEGGAASAGTASNSESSDDATAAAAAVIIEDVIVTDDDERSTSPQSGEDTNAAESGAAGASGGGAAPAATGSGDDSNTPTVNVTGVDSRRRTRPQVLAAVIQRYRTVETRLAPFLDRYHEILQQDPEFGEQDTAARENAQRTFDRVSEAMHYLSHAQHAISDLMLDMSQPGPRVLTCRPILVEQSGYIRSNNIFTPNNFAAPFTELLPQMPAPTANAAAANAESGQSQAASSSLSARAAQAQAEALNINQLLERLETDRDRVIRDVVLGPAPVEPQADSASLESGQAPNASHDDDLLEEIVEDERMLEDVAAIVAGLGQHRTENVEDPVDEPMVAPPTAPQSQDQQQQQQQQANEPPQQPNEHTEQSVESTGTEAEASRPRFRLYVPVPLPPPNPYMRIARLIQAVANSATNEADLRLEFNMPNVINLPVHVITAALHPQAAAAAGNAEAAGTGTSSTATAAAATSDTTTAAAAAGAAPATATVLGNASAAASTSSGTRSGDQRANTLPTTATQTRSTSRPQIQIGGNNNWAGRIAPTHTAFDRFLPCNSHHIREVEQPLVQQQQQQQQQPATTTQNNNNNNNNRSSSSSNSHNLRATIHPIVVPRRGGASNGPNYAVGGLGGNTAAAEAARVAVATLTSADAILNARAARTGVEAGSSSAPADVAGATVSDNNTTTAAAATSSGSQASRNLRAQVRSFLHQTVFEGEPINALTIPTAIDRALDWFADSLLYLRQYERPEYNSHDSVCNMLRLSLRLIIALCNDPSHCHVHFEHRLKQICEQFRMRLYSVLFLCLGSANAELFWRQLMRLLCVPLRSNFRNEALQFLCIYIDPTIPAHTDTADAQQFLVLRNAAQTTQPTDDDQQQQQQQEQQPEQQSLDNDIEMADVASSSNSSSATEMEPALPAVTAGSEPWHNSFPNDWLPVITRDLQTQTEQTRAQPPYSDAYISGMSAKRRKIIQTEKPPTNVECLIASGVQRAIHRAGLSGGTASNPAINTDAVINAIAHDAVVQTSYTDAVRTNARDRIKQDIDYKSSKYPQIAKFTEQK